MPFGIKLGNPARTFERRTGRLLDPLLATLQGQAQGAIADADRPQTSALYQGGLGAILGALQRTSETDAASAAARGLTGSGFEIAQGASRNQALTEALRGLLGQSSALLESRRRSSLGQLLQGTGLGIGAEAQVLGAKQDQLAMIIQALQSAGQSAATIAAGGGG